MDQTASSLLEEPVFSANRHHAFTEATSTVAVPVVVRMRMLIRTSIMNLTSASRPSAHSVNAHPRRRGPTAGRSVSYSETVAPNMTTDNNRGETASSPAER
jgi:hypothetical protein